MGTDLPPSGVLKGPKYAGSDMSLLYDKYVEVDVKASWDSSLAGLKVIFFLVLKMGSASKMISPYFRERKNGSG